MKGSPAGPHHAKRRERGVRFFASIILLVAENLEPGVSLHAVLSEVKPAQFFVFGDPDADCLFQNVEDC